MPFLNVVRSIRMWFHIACGSISHVVPYRMCFQGTSIIFNMESRKLSCLCCWINVNNDGTITTVDCCMFATVQKLFVAAAASEQRSKQGLKRLDHERDTKTCFI